MTERTFRLIAGITLWAVLWYSAYTMDDTLMYVFVGLMVFEGITNWRIPVLINLARYGRENKPAQSASIKAPWFNPFEAERCLRLIVAAMLLVTHFYLNEIFWFLPWFVTGMLIVAGITNVCPMVMFFRWIGFR